MADEKKHTYQSEVLGMPPLKMVLVHAENDRKNTALKPRTKEKQNMPRSQQEAVIKIIEHLKERE
jgi:hypothetical protein